MKSPNQKLSLEHSVLRVLKSLDLKNEKLLVAVSGGVDSVVLLHLLQLWRPYFRYEIAVAHVHHGKGSEKQMAFRQRSQRFVEKLARLGNLPFYTNVDFPSQILHSEEELRLFRWEQLQLWQRKFGGRAVVVAHHRDDQIETQLLRLIRGTSARGLKAMTHQDGNKMRPLLQISRAEIETYAKGRVKWCQDPSNSKTGSMRNWLRKKWLPQLEARLPGAKKSLARSLEMIVQEAQNQSEIPVTELLANGGVRRKSLSALTKKQQSLVMVEYLNHLGLKRYSSSHVNEILRRLDTRRKSSTFSLLGLSWSVSPDLVRASRV